MTYKNDTRYLEKQIRHAEAYSAGELTIWNLRYSRETPDGFILIEHIYRNGYIYKYEHTYRGPNMLPEIRQVPIYRIEE